MRALITVTPIIALVLSIAACQGDAGPARETLGLPGRRWACRGAGASRAAGPRGRTRPRG